MWSIQRKEKPDYIANQVQQRLSAANLPPTPQIYTLFYTYYSGVNPEVNRAVDQTMREEQGLTPELCEEIYVNLLSDKQEAHAIQENTRKLQELVTELTSVLTGAGTNQRSFQDNLQKKSNKLADMSDVGEIKLMVGALVDDTKRMIEENQKMAQRLDQSSGELQVMRQDMQELKKEAVTDALTGLPNRRAFDGELRTRAADALDKGRTLSLLMVDIDHFKGFNDTYGHQVGDQVLRLVARALQDGLKGQEFVARYGGEEFAIVLPDMKLKDAERLANKLRETIAAKDIVNQARGEKLGKLSISAGVTQFHAGEPLVSLIDRADRALYKAKGEGRNCVIGLEYDAALHANSVDDVTIEAR